MIKQGPSYTESKITASLIRKSGIASSTYAYDRDYDTIAQVSRILNDAN